MRLVTQFFAVFVVAAWGVGELNAQPGPNGHRPAAANESNETGNFEKKSRQGRGRAARQRTQAQDRTSDVDGRGRPRGGRELEQMLKRLDRDGDGRISRDEFPAQMRQRFDRMDANGDGFFDQSEQKKLMNRIGKSFQQGRRARGGKLQGGENGKAQRGRGGFGNLLKKLDANGDGQLSKEEVPERIRAHFDRLDSNGDGMFDLEEQRVAIERMQKRDKMQGGENVKKRRGNDRSGPPSGRGQKPKRPGHDG